MFHRHVWETTSVFFTEPRRIKRIGETSGVDEDFHLRLLYGFTTTVQQCSKCGLVRHHSMPGRMPGAKQPVTT